MRTGVLSDATGHMAAPERDTTDPRARRPWLRAARAGWLVTALALVGLDALGVPFAYRQLATPCPAGQPCSTAGLEGALTAHEAAGLRALGVPISGYAAYALGLLCMTMLVYLTVATLIFWRRSTNPTALLGAYALVTFGMTFGGYQAGGTMAALPAIWPALTVPVSAIRVFSDTLFAAFFCLFPSGHWVPRWAPVIVAVSLAQGVVQIAFPSSPLSEPQPLGSLIFFAVVVALVIVQIYRYRRVSTPRERQQTKWVVSGVAIGALCFLAIIGPVYALSSSSAPAQGDSPWGTVIGTTFVDAFITLIPISIGIAILRSRLWEIDVIIRRTLIYGTLTTILASVYFVMVITAQLLGTRLTGQTRLPAWLIVVTTLLVAALFTPLRRRVQRAIDRSFYRSRYDAARTIEGFAATMRTETDLRDLSEHLVSVVDETMRPASVSLWLRAPIPMNREVRR